MAAAPGTTSRRFLLLDYEHLKFRYVRVWNLFGVKMMIRPNADSRLYNFNMLDNVLDFMLRYRMIPYLDFGNRPECAILGECGRMVYYDEEKRLMRDVHDWQEIFEAFIEHIIGRYGREQVATWLFDFSMDIRDNYLTHMVSQLAMWQLYHKSFVYLKNNLPGVQVGGIGAVPPDNLEQAKSWISYCKENDCVPDFFSVLIFPYRQLVREGFGVKRVAGEDGEIRQIQLCRELLDNNGLSDCKLFVTEWNNALSTRNWLNDSCFRAAYTVDVANKVAGMVDVMAVWMGTDWCSSYYDTSHVANGGNGILTRDGVRKPIYHALAFFNRLHARVLEHGDGYLVTTNGRNDFYILCYNFKQYSYRYFQSEEDALDVRNLDELFADTEDLRLQFSLTGLPTGNFAIKKRQVNEEYGSLLGEWGRFEFSENLNARDLKYLRSICIPKLSMHRQESRYGRLDFGVELKAHEIALFHIYPCR